MAVKVAATIEPMGEGNFPVVAANHVSGLATVATTGSYNDLLDLPSPTGGDAEYAQKIGTSSSHPAIGSSSLPTYVNSSGVITPITELEVAGSHLIPAQSGLVDHEVNIYDAAWSTYRNAWECGYPAPLTTVSNWEVDRATIIIGGTSYYALLSSFANGNLNNYCPNATSYTTGTWAPIYASLNDTQVSGMCLQKQSQGNILLWMDTVIYTGSGSKPNIILSTDTITTQTTTEAGPAKITTPVLETSVKVETPILNASNEINCSVTHIIPQVKGEQSYSIELYDVWDWSLNRNCWEFNYLLYNTTAWTIDRAQIVLKSTTYYVYKSEFASGNLTDYCPNATSWSPTGTFAGFHDINTGNLISGACLYKTTGDRVLLYLDSVIYSGAYEEHTDFINEGDYFLYKKEIITQQGTVLTEKTDTSIASNLETITGKYIESTKSNAPKYIDLFRGPYKITLFYNSDLQCYKSSIDLATKGVGYGALIDYYFEDNYNFTTWYNAGQGPGYADITTYYSNTRYAIGDDGNCCVIETSENVFILCVKSSAYSSLQYTDWIYMSREITDADPQEGTVDIYGTVNIKTRGFYDANWEKTKSARLNCTEIGKTDISIKSDNDLEIGMKNNPGYYSEWLEYTALSGQNITLPDEFYLQPFTQVEINYWYDNYYQHDYDSKIIQPSDWFIVDNLYFRFDFYKASGSNPDPISVYYTTQDHKFHISDGMANITDVGFELHYDFQPGIKYRTSFITNGSIPATVKTVNVPAKTVMSDTSTGTLELSPEKIVIGNTNTIGTVTVTGTSITIGSTTINESQLQALLALIT